MNSLHDELEYMFDVQRKQVHSENHLSIDILQMVSLSHCMDVIKFLPQPWKSKTVRITVPCILLVENR